VWVNTTLEREINPPSFLTAVKRPASEFAASMKRAADPSLQVERGKHHWLVSYLKRMENGAW